MLIRGVCVARRKLEYTILNQSYNYASRSLCTQREGTPNVGKNDEELTKTIKPLHVPSNFDKYVLVWTKRYPSIAEVPKEVLQQTMIKARTEARIHANIFICICTAVICFIMAVSGRRAADREESLAKTNLEWHRRINEESRK